MPVHFAEKQDSGLHSHQVFSAKPRSFVVPVVIVLGIIAVGTLLWLMKFKPMGKVSPPPALTPVSSSTKNHIPLDTIRIRPNTSSEILSLITKHTQGWGYLNINQSVDGHIFKIADETFEHGLGTHSNSRITLLLNKNSNKKYKRFSGGVGADMEASAGSIIFKIMDGKNVLFQTPLMKRGMPQQKFNVSVENITTIDLVAENAGDGMHSDHADWVELNLK